MSTRATAFAVATLLSIVPATPVDAPPASAGHSLVYASHVGMVVLVNAGLGGMSQPPATTPTRVWGWTGTEWRVLDASGPPIRNLAGVTYDTKRQVLVMHGGSYDLGRMYGETWEWATGWRQIKGAGPGPRDHTQMAFDASRGRTVLFGGGGSDPNVVFGDTWEFDGSTWTRAPARGPAARVHHTMQYDAASQRVVLFGGVAPGAAGTFNDTWSWDGVRWTKDDAVSPARSHARMAFHGGLNALLAAGGFPAQPDLGLLRRTGTTWTPLAAPSGPASRYLTDIAYDEKRKVLVLFGGGGSDGMSVLNDTWEFDGTSWKRGG